MRRSPFITSDPGYFERSLRMSHRTRRSRTPHRSESRKHCGPCETTTSSISHGHVAGGLRIRPWPPPCGRKKAKRQPSRRTERAEDKWVTAGGPRRQTATRYGGLAPRRDFLGGVSPPGRERSRHVFGPPRAER